MSLTPGTLLGPYEILSPIGAGGMGQVWKARDTRLNRIVAIKTSTAQFSERFAQEARAIAALNHPNICTLHDVGPDYLVMEYVEGAPIKGPLPLEQALKLGIQMASALDAAHRRGITHRDLKPANILAAKSGVKVLDFGLAKMEQTIAELDSSLTTALTQPGTIMGTVNYMAPEQLQGRTSDSRADIFSLGCVLYEMFTGRRAFDGANTASVIVAILERDAPSLAELGPPTLDWAVRRCLEKDREDRWQSAGDLRAVLDRIAHGGAEQIHQARASRKPFLAWATAAALALVAGVLAFFFFTAKPPAPVVTRLSLEPPAKVHFTGEGGTPPAISPDGRKVVFEGVSPDGISQLWLRELDSVTAQPLAGTENGVYPFWSPDDKSVGFFAAGKLKRLDLAGGPPAALADAVAPRGGTWSRNGQIVFVGTPSGHLEQVSASGGAPREVASFDEKLAARRFPSFLPDGTHFVYLYSKSSEHQVLRVGSLTSGAEDHALPGPADSLAVYTQGHLLTLKGNTLVARPFDTKRLTYSGEPVAIAEQLHASNSPVGLAKLTASENGVLVYQGGLMNLALTWVDRTGKSLGTLGEPGELGSMEFSPDRKNVAVSVRDSSVGNTDIWLYDVARGLGTRFTFDPANDAVGVWSPKSDTLLFRSNRLGPSDLYRKPADGSRNEELLYASGIMKSTGSFSPDGKNLAYFTLGDPKTGYDIWIMPDPLGPPGSQKPYPFLHGASDENNPQFSPDGRWLAYQSNETGKFEVYVVPFPGPGGKRQVSAKGGSLARWRPDGTELFYIAPDKRLMAAQVEAKGGAFEVKGVQALFGPLLPNGFSPNYDVADTQKFLVVLPVEGEGAEALTVVQNWAAALKK